MVNISSLIYDRLYRRYIHPFTFKGGDYIENYKNAFAMMACACLLIETFISFEKGYKETPYNKAETLFNNFFKEQTNELSIFSSIGFYKNIRCAILHQGETIKWKLLRRDRLLDFETKSIKDTRSALSN